MRLAASAPQLFDRLFHDLKQPLNLIRVIAQDLRIDLARGRFEQASLPESMRSVEQAVDELVARIDRLRQLTRRRVEPAARTTGPPTAINPICRAAIDRIRATEQALEIETQLAGDLPALPLDPLALEQAVWELLDNGLHSAAAARAPRLRLETKLRDEQVVVSVEDNGEGVPVADRQRIFEPLFTTRGGSAGLGLALVRGFAKSARGTLDLVRGDAGRTLFELAFACPAPASLAEPEEEA